MIEIFLGELLTLVEQHFSAVVADSSGESASDEQSFQPPESAVLKDANLVVLVLSQPDNLLVLDRFAPVIFAQTLTRENPHIDDRTLDSGGDSQGRVAHFTRFFTKNRP